MGAGVATSPHCPSSMQRLPARRPAGRVVRTGPKPCSPRVSKRGHGVADSPHLGPVGAEAPAVPSGSRTPAREPCAPFPISGFTWPSPVPPKARQPERSRSFPLATGPVDRRPKPPLSGLGCFGSKLPGHPSVSVRANPPVRFGDLPEAEASFRPAFRSPVRSRGSSPFLPIPHPPKHLRSRSACRAGALRPRP